MSEDGHDDQHDDQHDDRCVSCKQVEGPNHEHICPGCQAVTGPSALIFGDDSTEHPIVVCDRFCLHEFQPDHPLLADVPEEVWEAGREKRLVKQEMNALKQKATKVGLPWI